MVVEIAIYLLTLFGSLSFVGAVGNSGYLNSGFQRGFAGVSTQLVSSNFLLNYTNAESFIRAAWEGQIGLTGYLFIGSLAALAITWASNLYNYRQAII
jgi:hypothetical protein